MSTEQVADKEGWREHDNKAQPVTDETIVNLRFASGVESREVKASSYLWDHPKLTHGRIVSYQVVGSVQ